MPTPDRFRDDYDPEPDYDRPTRAEAEADEAPPRLRYTSPPADGVVPRAPSDCSAPELARRLRRAAERVAGSRPDLCALLEEAADRVGGKEAF